MSCALLCFTACLAAAQNGPPPGSYVRSYVNDLPNQPLISVVVTGAVNVAAWTIEESLPGPATVLTASISGDGEFLPALNVIRWGPYSNIAATNVSYRLTGLPANYPVDGGAWMDGHWYFSPGITMVTVLPPAPTNPPPILLPQVAAPTFSPPSGGNVPGSVTIADTTPGATVYYTLDGSLPTQNSTLYNGSVDLASPGTIRAVAFVDGWTPSVASVAFYGPPAPPVDLQVTRSVDTNPWTGPVVTLSATPGSNATCWAVTESLSLGVVPNNLTAGGNYVASANVVLWGPFFGATPQTLSYQAVGQPGVYPVQASWSVDGVGGTEATGTNLVIVATNNYWIPPSPPPQVAAPIFSAPSGGSVPVSLSIADATPGAVIYYTLDGSLPFQDSTLYSGSIALSTASTIRAAAFMDGWTPSAVSVAFYGPPAVPADAKVARSVMGNGSTSPSVVLTLTPGPSAQCVIVTETLPPGIVALNVSSSGTYLASQNVVQWGPFFGTNVQTLTYDATGLAGTYPVRASWSVDGLGGAEAAGTNLVITGGVTPIPSQPQFAPTPVLTPGLASGLPVTVSISCDDANARIYYTVDGTLPTQSSAPYTGPLTFATRTSLRAVAFDTGYLPSIAAAGEYVPAPITITADPAQSVSGTGGILQSVMLNVTPPALVNCYAVVEKIPLGLTPYDISGDGLWDPGAQVIRWGPYTDNAARGFTFDVGGASGTYALVGEVSCNGYRAGTTESLVQLNANYYGPPLILAACATDYLTYNVDFNPEPGIITITSASGTVDWGDGTRSTFNQPVMTLEKGYHVASNYLIGVSVDWSGYAGAAPISGRGTKTDSVLIVTNCIPPQIVVQPASQMGLAGSTVLFAVSASSPVPMTFQWFFNTNFPYVGGVASLLTLRDIGPQAAGGYSVVLTNVFGSTTSSLASLMVVSPMANGDGNVGFTFAGASPAMTQIWATTNLASPAGWQPIFTNDGTAPNGTWQFTDTNVVSHAARYYRFSTP